MDFFLSKRGNRLSGSNSDLRMESPEPKGAIHQKRCSVVLIVSSIINLIFAIVGCTQTGGTPQNRSACGFYLPVLFALILTGGAIFATFTFYRRQGKRLPATIAFVSLIVCNSIGGICILIVFSALFHMISYIDRQRYYSRVRYSYRRTPYSTPAWVHVALASFVISLISLVCYVVCGMVCCCVSCYQQGGCCPPGAAVDRKEGTVQKFSPHDDVWLVHC